MLRMGRKSLAFSFLGLSVLCAVPDGGGNLADAAAAPGGPAIAVAAGTDNQNLNTIGLTLHKDYGYSAVAAAGIAGCIAGESGGNPESEAPVTVYPLGNPADGAGLIGWTPLSKLTDEGGTIGTTEAADLSSQTKAIDTYNKVNWAAYIPQLNAETDPEAAARFYSENFERPKSLDSDVVPGAATAVLAYINNHS